MSRGHRAVLSVALSNGRYRTEAGDAPLPKQPPPDPELAAIAAETNPKRRAGLMGARARRMRARARGIATLNPAKCESWLQPHVEAGHAHALDLAARFSDPVLHELVGMTADAAAMFRGLISLAASGGKQAGEARAWLREYRACLRELCVLAGEKRHDEPDPHAALEAAFAAERNAK